MLTFEEFIVTVQYPIIVFLIAVSFQLARSLGLRRSYVIACGWGANLSYLVAHRVSLRLSEPEPVTYLADFLVLFSSLCFLAAVRMPWHTEGQPTLPAKGMIIGLSLFSAALLVGVLDIVVTYLATRQIFALRFFHACVDVSFHMYALFSMGQYLQEAQEKVSVGEDFFGRKGAFLGYKLLPHAARFYASIQPLYVISYLVPESVQVPILLIGFTLGFLSKTLLAVGYLNLLFGVATQAMREKVRMREEEAKLREVKAVVGRINHEVGTPLAEISMIMKDLHSTAPSHGRFRESTESLDNALHRVSAIMEAARDVAILIDPHGTLTDEESEDLAHQQSTPVVANVNTLVQAAAMSVKSTRKEVFVTWKYQYSGGLCIRCVPSEIVQVLINIFRNAYDAFPERRGVLQVCTTRVRQEVDEALVLMEDEQPASRTIDIVRIEIRDNGEGVSEDHIEHIFSEGFTTRSGQGRGYGLGVVKDLVARNGGVFNLKSPAWPERPNAPGTEVMLQFPRVPCKS